MRIFGNFVEAVDEVERELLEMGHRVQSHSYQNVTTEGNLDFETCELMGYNFMVSDISRDNCLDLLEAKQLNTFWFYAELEERTSSRLLNPGEAWKIRRDVWEQFLNDDGRFDYSYPERFDQQLDIITEELRVRPNSRQAIIQMYRHDLDHPNFGGKARIPCTMFYQFMVRNGALNVIYIMRSSDFYLHFCYDITLAAGICGVIASRLNLPVGSGTYFFSSLHAFRKDLIARGVF